MINLNNNITSCNAESYLGIYNDFYKKTFCINIVAKNREEADLKFINWIKTNDFSTINNNYLIIPMSVIKDLETI